MTRTPAMLRALAVLAILGGPDRAPVLAGYFAEFMWPDGRKKGRNRAGGGYLGKLQTKGVVSWTVPSRINFGYVLTQEGRRILREHSKCRTCRGEGEIETGQSRAGRCVDCGGSGWTGGEPPNRPLPRARG